jgi:superfamily I DNA/RNA helicase
MWIIPKENLTPDQQSAVNLSLDKHRIVVGAPGAGKTLVLAHRANSLVAKRGTRDGVKFLVYTKVLVEFIREGMSQLGFGDEDIQTFDKWCLDEYRSMVKGSLPKDSKGKLDFGEVHRRVLEAVTEKGEKRYEAIFVDEGQDLSETAVTLLGKISKHVTIALDSKQQMYDGRVNLKTAAAALGIEMQASMLLASYRCTPLIRDVAAEFLDSDEEAKSFRAFHLYGIDGVEKPSFAESSSDEEEWDTFANLLQQRALLSQTCAILMPTRRGVFKAKRELERRNVSVSTHQDADFTDLQPEVLTYHSAKGLTVDCVFMPNLTESQFSSVRKIAPINKLLFVGSTRASKWLCLGTRAEETVSEVSEVLESLIQKGSIVKHNRQPASEGSPAIDDEKVWL